MIDGGQEGWMTAGWHLEDRLEEAPAEDEGGVVVREGVAEGGHVAVAQPPGVVHLQGDCAGLRSLAKVHVSIPYQR